ncbi:hypothetical protein EV122DRAFT_284662 [Schizophyllum commune]
MASGPGQRTSKQPGLPDLESTVFTIEEHMTVEMQDGISVRKLQTAFELDSILLEGLPYSASARDIEESCATFGRLVGIETLPRNSYLVQFARVADADFASKALHGKVICGAQTTVRLLARQRARSDAGTTFNDATVRVAFQIPTKTIYAGYSTLSAAEAGIRSATKPIRHHTLLAEIHKGVPAVELVTVRFSGLPMDVTPAEVQGLGSPISHMVEIKGLGSPVSHMYNNLPRLSSAERVETAVEGYVYKQGGVLSVQRQQTPYRNGRSAIWVTFSSAAEARSAALAMNGRKPSATAGTEISARYSVSMTLDMRTSVYCARQPALAELARAAQESGVQVTFVPRQNGYVMQARMHAPCVAPLGSVRKEMILIVRGQILSSMGRNVWHPFFTSSRGREFIRQLHTRGICAFADACKRELRVAGSRTQREEAAKALSIKLDFLESQHAWVIPLPLAPIGLYIDSEVTSLRKRLGNDRVNLDVRSRALVLHGSFQEYTDAVGTIYRASQRLRASDSPDRTRSCPVCFVEIATGATLRCGHSWCIECIRRFILASADNRSFPLVCLGDTGRCSERLSCDDARSVLNDSEFCNLVCSSLAAHVADNPNELMYCPTPDCKQVYRRAPDRRTLQCPSCLLRFCTACRAECHGSLPCDGDDGALELAQWMESKGAKHCPGCRAPIERTGGCHHVVCSQCKTHMCWVCMETFVGGDGIYGHMRTEHGSIGLDAV